MHHVQCLHHCTFGVTLARRVTAGIRPTKGVQKLRANLEVPRLQRARTAPRSTEAGGHAGYIAHRIQQHFRPQAPPVAARKIARIGRVGGISLRAKLVQTAFQNRANKRLLVVLELHEMFRKCVEQRGVHWRIRGTHVVHRLHQSFAEIRAPHTVYQCTGEERIIRLRHPIHQSIARIGAFGQFGRRSIGRLWRQAFARDRMRHTAGGSMIKPFRAAGDWRRHA